MSDDILHTGRADIHHPKGPLTGGQAARSECAEGCAWASHMRGGQPLYIQICMLCKRINWEDLAEQVDRVRATALHDFAASMRALAEQAPEGATASWPWTAYALAAVKAEESAGRAGNFEARVRAAVAEELWQEAQRVRAEDWPAKVGIEYVNGFEAAVGWVEQHAAVPSVRPDTDRTPDVGTPEGEVAETAHEMLRQALGQIETLTYVARHNKRHAAELTVILERVTDLTVTADGVDASADARIPIGDLRRALNEPVVWPTQEPPDPTAVPSLPEETP